MYYILFNYLHLIHVFSLLKEQRLSNLMSWMKLMWMYNFMYLFTVWYVTCKTLLVWGNICINYICKYLCHKVIIYIPSSPHQKKEWIWYVMIHHGISIAKSILLNWYRNYWLILKLIEMHRILVDELVLG